MSFTSLYFPLFLAGVFLLYFVVPRRWRWVVLLAASYAFYAFTGPLNLVFIVATTAATWYAARRVAAVETARKADFAAHPDYTTAEKKSRRDAAKKLQKRWLTAGLLVDLGILAVVKYTNFVVGNVNSLIGSLGIGTRLGFLQLALPLGISFYVFMAVGYLIDVYRNRHPAEANPFRLALFVSFFPQLIQGPISRFGDLSKTLYEPHDFDAGVFSRGIQRVLWGYFKKVVIADRVFVAVQSVISEPGTYQGGWVLMGMLFYALQLYADFTGGIDITIGIAESLGIKVTENFLRPYFSKNIIEYWRRWHISMGAFFRDYVFYPVSFSKFFLKLSTRSRKWFGESFGRRFPVHVATTITWLATGIWHGAAWNFIVWGLLNGLIIILTGELEPAYKRFHARFPAVAPTFGWRLFQVLRTFLLMSSLRILDCYRDVGTSFAMFGTLFSRFSLAPLHPQSWRLLGLSPADTVVLALGTALLITVSLAARRGSVRDRLARRPYAFRQAVWIALLLIIIVIGVYGLGYDATGFIYAQF